MLEALPPPTPLPEWGGGALAAMTNDPQGFRAMPRGWVFPGVSQTGLVESPHLHTRRVCLFLRPSSICAATPHTTVFLCRLLSPLVCLGDHVGSPLMLDYRPFAASFVV